MAHYNPLTIEELRSRINKGEIKDPIVFLESVMNGNDIRVLSDIYKLITDIDEFTGGDITRSDWDEILEHTTKGAKYKLVGINESIGAAKTLAEYLYPKRKQVEITNKNNKINSKLKPLTEKEIKLFRTKFNENF